MASTLIELIYHVFFSTKDRKPMICPNMRDELYYYIGGIIIKQDAVLLQIGGIEDHLHIVIKVKPTHKLSELM
jgi:REP element-mobilizing transposase RayT